MKCSHVRSSSWAESCHHELCHWQKAVLTRRGGITWSYLVQKWDSSSRAGDLGYRVNLPCLILERWSCCFLLYPFAFLVFLVLWLWILWFLATWSSWYMAVGSGTVFTCKSCSRNKSTEKILSKSAERFWHYFMKHKLRKVSTSKRILLHIFSLDFGLDNTCSKTKVKTKLWGNVL